MWVSSHQAARSSGASNWHCTEQLLHVIAQLAYRRHAIDIASDVEGDRRDVACGGPSGEHKLGELRKRLAGIYAEFVIKSGILSSGIVATQ